MSIHPLEDDSSMSNEMRSLIQEGKQKYAKESSAMDYQLAQEQEIKEVCAETNAS